MPNHFLAFLQVEESQVAVSVCADHEGLELVHCDGEALLLGHDEVEAVLKVVHVPHLDSAVVATAADKVVLIELIVPR